MFSGLIEAVGRVTDVAPRHGATRIGIESSLPAAELVDGESIAVDGVCLTVAERRTDRFLADVVAETLARTTLGRLRPGDPVNLERSLRLGDRVGGHLVLGHVDGTVRVRAVRRRGDDYRMRIDLPAALAPYVPYKGSVALQGVSLTVAGVGRGGFEVALVPHTLEWTTLGRFRAGETMNFEVDLLARYLERLIAQRRTDG
ncbi:MAG TPA: riboflavin synthase [Candidatus Polarisedimenticolaceae bacterium]|nr:riboflavin synthase [Candidatus Polarisedimenticolaceae bacterium]